MGPSECLRGLPPDIPPPSHLGTNPHEPTTDHPDSYPNILPRPSLPARFPCRTLSLRHPLPGPSPSHAELFAARQPAAPGCETEHSVSLRPTPTAPPLLAQPCTHACKQEAHVPKVTEMRQFCTNFSRQPVISVPPLCCLQSPCNPYSPEAASHVGGCPWTFFSNLPLRFPDCRM